MNKSFQVASFTILILVLVAGVIFSQSQPALASNSIFQQDSQVVRGAQLYDDWTQLVQVQVPGGNQPIWGRQSTNTRSGVDTWLCVSCHGWDYQGKDGAFRTGDEYTGFPGVFESRDQSVASLGSILAGQADPNHDFSPYLSAQDMEALAAFIREGTLDDNQFIDPVSLKVLGGDLAAGKSKYEQGCASCHGADGQQISFRYQGQTVVLGTLAVQDPWRFLHRTRFGTARASDMTIGVELGWTPQDGRDVLLYAQSFPTGFGQAVDPSLGGQEPGVVEQPGGPAGNFFTGILTALGAMATSLGFAVLLGALLVGILFLVVWVIRSRK